MHVCDGMVPALVLLGTVFIHFIHYDLLRPACSASWELLCVHPAGASGSLRRYRRLELPLPDRCLEVRPCPRLRYRPCRVTHTHVYMCRYIVSLETEDEDGIDKVILNRAFLGATLLDRNLHVWISMPSVAEVTYLFWLLAVNASVFGLSVDREQ